MRGRGFFWFLIAFILILAHLLFLFPATNFGLPHFFSVDEPFLVDNSLKMVESNDWNPHFFHYGGLTYYLLFGVFKARSALLKEKGRLRGYFAEGFVREPERDLREVGYYRAGRIAILFLSASILFSFFLFGVRAYGVLPSFLALLMLLFNPLVARMGVYVNPDVPMLFFLSLSFLFGLSFLREEGSSKIFFAGFLAGLAVGAKLSALPLIGSLALLLFLKRRRFFLRFTLLGLGAILGFLLVNPAAIFDRGEFWRETFMMSQVIPLKVSANLASYFSSIYENLGWAGVILLAISLFLVVKRRDKVGVFLFSFALFYVASMSLGRLFHFRYTLPLIPVFFLLIGEVIGYFSFLLREKLRISIRVSALIAVSAVTLLFLPQLLLTARAIGEVKKPLAVAEAKKWIEENAEDGALIGREYYTPYIDPRRFRVYFLHRLMNRPPRWYLRMNFDYLLLSSENYVRLFPGWYRALLSRCEQVREFPERFSPIFGINPAVLVVKPLSLPDDRLLRDGSRYLIFRKGREAIIDIGNNDEVYLGRGFSDVEQEGKRTFRWSLGGSSSLFFPLKKARSMMMTLILKPFLYPGVSAQVIEVRLNGKSIGKLVLSHRAFSSYKLTIPRRATKPGVNELSFGYRYYASPAEVIPGSGDLRVIAVAYDLVRLVALE